MNLSRCLEFINQHEKELTLVNCESADSLADDLRMYFDTQNVRIRTVSTASQAPTDIAVLSGSDSVLTIVSTTLLRQLLAEVPAGTDNSGIADQEYEPILGHLKETTFTSYDTEQMLYASREIEDRARRMGGGTLHAGFQRFSIMATQQPIYTDLARRGLTIHAYGVPDVAPPDLGAGHTHASETDEIATMWFVVFDGGGDSSQKSALLAEEQSDETFYGAWTYDAVIVNRILEYLEQTYLPADDTLSPSGT